MKIAWLVWEHDDDDCPTLIPDGHWKLDAYSRKVRIVYAEVDDSPPKEPA